MNWYYLNYLWRGSLKSKLLLIILFVTSNTLISFAESFAICTDQKIDIYKSSDSMAQAFYTLAENKPFKIIKTSGTDNSKKLIKFYDTTDLIEGWINSVNINLIISEEYYDIAVSHLMNSGMLTDDFFWDNIGGKRWKEHDISTKERLFFDKTNYDIVYEEEYITSSNIIEFTKKEQNVYTLRSNLLYEFGGTFLKITYIDEYNLVIQWGNETPQKYIATNDTIE